MESGHLGLLNSPHSGCVASSNAATARTETPTAHSEDIVVRAGTATSHTDAVTAHTKDVIIGMEDATAHIAPMVAHEAP